MKGRNSSKYYRKNSYKKRKLRNILIVSGICLLFLFLLFVIFGNLLDKKVEAQKGEREKTQATTTSPTYAAAYSIEAYPVDISAGSDVASQMSALSSADIRAASLRITDSNGKLLIRSKLATSLGYQGSADLVSDFSSVISRAKYYDIFPSAVLDLQFLSESDAKHRAVLLAYEAALVAEVSEAGAGEVIARASSVDETQIALLIDFAESVKSINDKAVLGIVLPKNFFYMDAAADNVAKLAESFDILGVDASKPAAEDADALAYIESVFSEPNLKYYVLRYNMRVLLPQISSEQDAEMRAVLAENSIQNWQKIS